MAELERAWHKGQPYDLVFLDQMMPGLSGEGLAKRLRALPAFAETKLVLVSSAGTQGLSKPTMHLLDAILEKPLRQQDLLDCLLNLFAARSSDAGAKAPVETHPEPKPTPTDNGLDILLVEDNRINQLFALALLNKAGHAVTVADNGHKAVDAVRKHQYDAVLMDIQMPELDGIEATKQIRALPPPACNAHIIAMTANAMTGAREEYVAAGMNDYVSKPIDGKNLLTRLANLPGRVTKPARAVAETPPPEPPRPHTGGAVDVQKLDELAQYLPISGIVDLVLLFTSESDGHAARIKSHLAEKDYPAIAREAHILVSTAGNIGAMHLSATARTLEHACKSDCRDDIDRLVGELGLGITAANAGFAIWIAAHQTSSAKTRERV
jgi:CheY-like chemotaxis protein/HPt (histidine-containing phosphotransfer) domain-containing protein